MPPSGFKRFFNRKNPSVKNETSKYTKKPFVRGGFLKLKISRAAKKVPQPPPTTHIPRMIFFDFPTEIIFRIADDLEVDDLSCFLQTSPRLARILYPDLLRRAATHNLLHYHNRTVLHWASAHHRIDLVQALLAHGASANTSDEWGMTPLHSAVLTGNNVITLMLLENGAIIDQVDTEYEVTALQCAALLGNRVIAGLLLNHGANIDANSRRSIRMTAVQFAVVLGYVSVVELLVGRGCRLDKIYDYGPTPAVLARQSGRGALVELVGGLTQLYDTTIDVDAYGVTLNGTNEIRGILIGNENDCACCRKRIQQRLLTGFGLRSTGEM